MGHPRYVIITNIWGRKPRKITPYYSEWCDFEIKNNPIFVDEERYEFDTLEELNEHIELFKEMCKDYEKPSSKTIGYSRWEKHKEDVFDSPNKRKYGYLYGDRETMRLVWGFDKLYRYNKSTNNLKLYDILFRGADEIPKDYKWDDGEYEGWLQYRWGDGKNAVGYVEPVKKKKIEDIAEDHSEAYERLNELLDKKAKWIESHPSEYTEYLNKLVDKYEEIENDEKFDEIENLNSLISSFEANMLSEEDDDYTDENEERRSEFAEALEEAFAKEEERERMKIIENRW